VQLVDASVLVATRDRPEALARCLNAVLSGEALPREVVIVDQGAMPQLEVASEPVSIVLIRDQGIGLSRARNLGLDAVRQPLVAVVDDDCVPAPSWLAAIAGALAGADAVAGRVLPLPADGAGVFALSSRTSVEQAEYRRTTAPWRVGTGGNFAARTDLLRKLGGYDERLGAGAWAGAGEDLDLIHRALRSGATIRYAPEVLVFHARASAGRRRSTRSSYGRGAGAFIGLRLRAGEAWAVAVLCRWVFDRAVLLVRGAFRGDRRAVSEELLVLGGTIRGLIHGVRSGAGPRSAAGPSR
jgi:GT2 family glycosyltransferase